MGGEVSPSLENTYQLQKKVRKGAIEKVKGLTPGQSKSYMDKKELRGDWEEVKISVLLDLVRLKFNQDRLLKGSM